MPRLQDQAGAPLISTSHDRPEPPPGPAQPETPLTTSEVEPGASAAADPGPDSPPRAGGDQDPTLGPDPAPAPAHTRDPARRRRQFALLAGIAVAAYVIDQVTKAWAIASLTDQPATDLVGSFLRLELIRNPGAAFSIGTGNTWVLTLIAVVVLVVVIRASRRLGSTGWAWALGLLLGGALGNLTDRLIREPGLGRGHVVDFINYNGWFIGNVADIAIVSAAVLIGLLALIGRRVDGTRETREPHERGRHEATRNDG